MADASLPQRLKVVVHDFAREHPAPLFYIPALILPGDSIVGPAILLQRHGGGISISSTPAGGCNAGPRTCYRFMGTFSRTIQFDIVSPLPRRSVDERLRPVVRTPGAKSGGTIFKGDLHPQGFSLRRRAPFPGMLFTLQGTYIPESSGTRVVVLASGASQVMLAVGMITIYLIIFTVAIRAYVMNILFNGGTITSLLAVPAGYLIPFIYLIFALRRAKRGMVRDREDLERVLMGTSQMR